MSDDSTYLGIFYRVFDDLVNILPEYSPAEASRDRDTCVSRVRSEGLGFLTKTLPSLAKHFERALEIGTFKPFPGLSRKKGRTTPAFLGALFKETFNDEGDLLGNPNSIAVRAVRQVCYFMYKFDSDYPSDLVEKVVNDFVDVDRALQEFEGFDRQQRLLLTIARAYVVRIFRDFDPLDILPRPGPGASASGTHKAERYEPKVHYSRIHERYPYYRYFYVGTDHLLDRAHTYRNLPRKKEAVSVLRTVPKDSRGPRIICMEEQEMMFLQQGLADSIRLHLESHPLTSGRVNFGCQEINQQLALRSSIDGVFATLDMKEASDRITRQLVSELFSDLPVMRDCLLALSTRHIKLPSGEIIDVNKFAPMGSSLCFPIMSIVHYVLAIAAIHCNTGLRTDSLAKDVYVYGDDIIVKSQYAPYLFEAFPLFYLKFNETKSFYRGRFRESCGVDAFQGVNVSPQRLKRRFFDGRDPSDLRSVMDMHKALYDRGFYGMASMLQCVTENRYGKFPSVACDSKFLGWRHKPPISEDVIDILCRAKHDSFWFEASRMICDQDDFEQFDLLKPHWDADRHCYTVSARVMRTEPDCSMAGGWEQLMRAQVLAKRNSARLDGRWSRKIIEYQRDGWDALNGKNSSFLPIVRIN